MSQNRPPAAPSLRGAVDLSSLRRPARPPEPPRPAAAAPPAPPGADAVGSAPDDATTPGTPPVPVVHDVTDATFPTYVELSRRVPVVVDLWATWCAPCRQLSPILERLAEELGGRILLAKVDVDANPQIAAAFQVQSIPSVVAIVAGQPVPMFQGAYPEPQVRAILDELLAVAARNGVDGTLADVAVPDAEALPPEPELPPLHQEAYDALERDDLAGAARAFSQALRENPRDADAKAGLAQVELLQRLVTVDAAAVLRAAAADPSDVDAELAAADVEVASNRAAAAFERLLRVVRETRGPERDRVRLRLLDLFEVVGTTAPEVAAARRSLAAALY